ncbi:MAG: AAA family ATPase [Hahellaceae bacterium]|jgi:MSHA biogenesis protein MshM|nr:AAA family ATPase [Hahellaceae bacterium]MCP5210530.1 AAA family ATPase [Hahellaceae bacterium]
MYESFFGLKEQPFSLTPNTHFYLNSQTHHQALELLLVALKNREGFIKIVGEVGTGKTLLCRMLLNSLQKPFYTAYIPNPGLSPDDLYLAVCEELEVEVEPGKGGHHLLKRLSHRLIELALEGRQVVLIIDEAQAMSEPTIEALRLLTNLETESAKLLQVVLFGQPELDDMLSKASLRQLLQRITFQQNLSPLDRNAVGQYVYHRLAQAGYNGPSLFDRRAIALLHRATGGVPRLVNILSHKALMSAYGQGNRVIKRSHVKKAIEDTQSVTMPRFSWLPVIVVGLLVAGIVPLGGWW